MVYEVEFHTTEFEYEYDINAQTGEVVFSEKEAKVVRDEEDKPVISPEVTLITEQEAINAALAHAGLENADTVECELDKDHGNLYYEIEFVAGNTEYEYLVDAVSGKVIRHQKESEEEKRPQPEAGVAPEIVDAETVKQIVLTHAGATEVKQYECELDRDHNKLVYEVEFESGSVEYEYTVDAATGDILRFRKEAEDDRPAEKPNGSESMPIEPSQPVHPTESDKADQHDRPVQNPAESQEFSPFRHTDD